jgi:hypothetical protein
MTQMLRHETRAAVRPALPVTHQVTFSAADDTGAMEAWQDLIAALERKGCTGAGIPDSPSSPVPVGLPGGGACSTSETRPQVRTCDDGASCRFV